MYKRQGGSSASIRDLTERMNEAAENLEFERAARIRDRIQAIRNIGDKQKVVATRVREQDIIALAPVSYTHLPCRFSFIWVDFFGNKPGISAFPLVL